MAERPACRDAVQERKRGFAMGMTKPTALICVRKSETLKVCVEALERSGFHVRTADCGRTAAGATVFGMTADVVVLEEDYVGCSTVEMVEQLKAFQTHASTPHLLVIGEGPAHEMASRFGIPARQCLVENPLTRWSVMNALSWVITRPASAEAAEIAVVLSPFA